MKINQKIKLNEAGQNSFVFFLGLNGGNSRSPNSYYQQLRGVLIFILLITFSGCMEIENRIILQLDGSAVIKENVRIHKELLAYSDDSGKAFILEYLEKSACEDRANAFGKGTVLRKHSLKNLKDGVKLLEAEYYIPDITDLYIINPYLGFTNYAEMGSCKLSIAPSYQNSPGTIAGMLYLSIVPEKRGVGQQKIKANEPLIKPPSPIVLQKYRSLQPVFKHLMKHFKLSVIFEAYDTVDTNFGVRGKGSRPKSCEILSFSGSDYDNLGGLILDNDDIMQEVLQQKFWDYNFIKTAQNFRNNLSGPVVSDEGSPYAHYHRGEGAIISFKPSKHYFQKFFEGKELNLGQHQKFKIIKAEFDQIGYDPNKDIKNVSLKSKVESEDKDKTELPIETSE